MKRFETAHYVFHYHAGSKAEQDITEIAALQERCYAHICACLQTQIDFKIQYYLCLSPEDVGAVYGDDEPCNGFCALPDKIYAVYNEDVQCIGFHEDAHIISYTINRPDPPAIREGIAMYFDRQWWGISNLAWTRLYLDTCRYIPVDALLDKQTFFAHDCALTYPIMGAFTDWLISRYGMAAYLAMYNLQDTASAMTQIYGQTPGELDQAFQTYVRLFHADEAVTQRMEALLSTQ